MSVVSLIQVSSVERITPRMARITFTDDGLADLATWPDQQLKLLFPRPGQQVPRLPAEADAMRWYEAYQAIPEDERPVMRSFTLRELGTSLVIDFVLHGDAGPAAEWALTARPGDTLGRYGPSEVYARPLDFAAADWVLLAGDETALPAVGSLLESTLGAGTRVVACLEVADAAEEQRFASTADVTVHWQHRNGAPHGRLLVEAVRALEFPPGAVFAWLAGEASMVRTLRRHLVDDREVPKRSIDFAGYWRARLTQDDPPTKADLAEAQERLTETNPTQ